MNFLMFRKVIIVIVFYSGVSTFVYGQGGKKGEAPVVAQVISVASKEEGGAFKLAPHFNGFNAQMMKGPSWQEAGFVEKVKALHPKLIRYPGGTVASYWDWQTGWLKEGIESKPEWKAIKRSPITLSDLKFGCEATGASPLFVLNMMTGNLESQMAMLKAAKGIGLPIIYVELDNELYLGDNFYVNRFPTGVEYAKECNEWILALKAEFPGVKIGVVGSSTKEGTSQKGKKNFARTNSWNRDVLSAVENADAMVFHVYGGTGLGFFTRTGFGSSNDEDSKPELIQSIFDTKEAIPVVLGVPWQRWKNTHTYDYQILPDGMKVWITEYNLFEKEGVVAGTWVHGLYVLLQSANFMRDSRSEIICYHNLATSAQFAAIFNNDQGFAKAVKKKPNAPFNYSAAGYCLSYFGKLVADGGEVVRLKFSLNEQMQGARGMTYPSLEAWAVKSDKSNKVLVVNLSPEPVMVDFSKVIQGNVTYSQLSAAPHTQVASESDINKSSGAGKMVNLKAYSVTIIEGE